MTGFRPPYRIVTVYERLKARSELKDCSIRLEELPDDREAGYFPTMTFDTVRVFVDRDDFSINIMGRIENGEFTYQVNVYDKNGPANPQHWAKMTHIDEMIDTIVGRFSERFP